MVNWTWIGIGAIILVVAFLFLKFQAKKVRAIFLGIILLIVAVTAIGWYKNGDADFSSPSNSISSVYLYFSWVGENGRSAFSFGKSTASIVGNVVKGNYSVDELFDGRR